MPSSRDSEVLIVGAGPTGLVLALWLTRLGVRVKIVDKTEEPGTTSRALGVQARTLELYAQMGLADAVVESGRRVAAANLWVAGRRAARAVLGDMGAGISPYPYALVYPQDEHERMLIGRLREAGVEVDRQTELLEFEESQDGVRARLRHSAGADETHRTLYLAGCDGAHSAVRDGLGIGFPGGTYDHLFYVADVLATGPTLNGEIHVALDATDFLAVFPLKGERRARLIGTVREDSGGSPEALSWDDVSTRVFAWMPIEVARVNWFSTYRVHHRVADRFRSGRAFLLGDAAHIHSPVGAQGMNTGIGDAVNLAWKLAASLQGTATPAILDTYEPERIAFARRLVDTTDRAFTAVTSVTAFARALRLHVVPRLLPTVFAFRPTRRLMFRTVSQTVVSYRGSALSEGRAGRVHGGDRLPWVSFGPHADNFAPLRSLDWQVHVYGEPARDLRSTCDARRISLHIFEWQPSMSAKGIARNGTYLVRPDGYVALAVREHGATALTSYLEARGVRARGTPERTEGTKGN